VLGIEINPATLEALAMALGPIAIFYTPTLKLDRLVPPDERVVRAAEEPTTPGSAQDSSDAKSTRAAHTCPVPSLKP
jgi:hypothetical protein